MIPVSQRLDKLRELIDRGESVGSICMSLDTSNETVWKYTRIIGGDELVAKLLKNGQERIKANLGRLKAKAKASRRRK